jgi:hypothetical protein
MNVEERREASAAFSDTLRAKWAESRRGFTAEDLMGRKGEEDTAPGGRNERDGEGGRE